MPSRRDFMKTTGGLVLATGGAWAAGHARGADSVMGPPELPEGTLSSSMLEALPGKVPLIKKTWRPPNFETPISYFNDAFTPNDAFFVRYHVSNIPEVAAASWRLKIGGESVTTPLELTLDNLKNDYEQVEIAAVGQTQVEQHSVGRGLVLDDAPQRRIGVAGFDGLVAAGAKRLGDGPADERLVIDDQHPPGCGFIQDM